MDYNTPEKAAERVAIARDALEWIRAGALIPRHMRYVETTNHIKYGEGDKQLRDVNLGPCKVCAKGALLLSKAVRFDNLLAKDLSSGREKALLEHFDKDQLRLIEYTYEGWDYLVTTHIGEAVGGAVRDFGKKYFDSKKRLIAILKNIIKNNGTFSL